jgi:hypothetical protein
VSRRPHAAWVRCQHSPCLPLCGAVRRVNDRRGMADRGFRGMSRSRTGTTTASDTSSLLRCRVATTAYATERRNTASFFSLRRCLRVCDAGITLDCISCRRLLASYGFAASVLSPPLVSMRFPLPLVVAALLAVVVSRLRSPVSRRLENLTLRHQLAMHRTAGVPHRFTIPDHTARPPPRLGCRGNPGSASAWHGRRRP